MRVLMGYSTYERRQNNQEVAVVWDSDRVINGHMFLVGSSGMGKTHTLCRLLPQMAQSAGVRIHTFDVHGDIDVPGASTVRFSQASSYGFNPLTIDPDVEYGGVLRRVNAFVRLLEKTCGSLGSRQEAVLRALLVDLFIANGFYQDNASSWGLGGGSDRRFPKKFPQFADAVKYGETKLRATFLGTSTKAAVLLDKVNKMARKMQSLQKAAERSRLAGDGELAKVADDFDKAKIECKDAFIGHLDALQFGGSIDDLLKYESVEILKSVLDRLRNLGSYGIFKADPPPFSPTAPIWRYDLAPVPVAEQRLFVETRLEQLFREAVQCGITKSVRTVIVLDEAHRFFDDSDSSVLRKIALEGRKFGLALVCASQSPGHFGEDFLTNVGTKVVLGLDSMLWAAAVRHLRIEEKTLKYLTPRRTLAVQMRAPGESGAKFVEVEIPRAQSRAAA